MYTYMLRIYQDFFDSYKSIAFAISGILLMVFFRNLG